MTEQKDIEAGLRYAIRRWRRLSSEDHLIVYEGVGEGWCVIVCSLTSLNGHCTATAAHSGTDLLLMLTDEGAAEMRELARTSLKT